MNGRLLTLRVQYSNNLCSPYAIGLKERVKWLKPPEIVKPRPAAADVMILKITTIMDSTLTVEYII